MGINGLDYLLFTVLYPLGETLDAAVAAAAAVAVAVAVAAAAAAAVAAAAAAAVAAAAAAAAAAASVTNWASAAETTSWKFLNSRRLGAMLCVCSTSPGSCTRPQSTHARYPCLNPADLSPFFAWV